MLIPTPRRILVARDPVDFRKSFDGLAAVCQRTLSEQPLDGTRWAHGAETSAIARWARGNRASVEIAARGGGARVARVASAER
ncbi:MAG: hypothetical protein EA397_17475 [Deltaproteobacteria bacterium]|nr:MAG: hypothetical protein EA397_17475 [Deltaproteobacteria bacterium]